MLEARLEAALNSWQQWSVPLAGKPTFIKALEGGETNRSYLVSADQAVTTNSILAVVRLNSPYSKQLGINRVREKRILEIASKAGLAPEIYFNNLDILVTQFLPGGSFSNSRHPPPQREKYLDLLQKVHLLVSETLPSFSYLSHTEYYWQQLISAKVAIPTALKNHRDIVLNSIEAFEQANPVTVLCHHDPGLHNVLEVDGQLKLIDWEYAAIGIADIDFAASGIIEPVNPEARAISDYINRLWLQVKNLLE